MAEPISNTTIIELTRPIMHGSEEITELKATRELTVSDIEDVSFSNQTFGQYTIIGSKLFNQPVSVMRKLCMKDYSKVFRVVNHFLEDFQPTGDDQ